MSLNVNSRKRFVWLQAVSDTARQSLLGSSPLGRAEGSFPGTQTHRNCFQCYFYFAKINTKLLKDPSSRSKLEMAIIPQAVAQAAVLNSLSLYKASLHKLGHQSGRHLLVPCLPQLKGLQQEMRFTGSHGGTDVLVWLAKDRVQRAVRASSSTQLHLPTYSSWVFLTEPEPARQQEARPGVMEAQPGQPQPRLSCCCAVTQPRRPQLKGATRDSHTCSPGQVQCFCFCLLACHPP